jgi:hypothetical protein
MSQIGELNDLNKNLMAQLSHRK